MPHKTIHTSFLLALVTILFSGIFAKVSPIQADGLPTSGQDQQQALNFLLFSSTAARQHQHDNNLEELLKDSNHSHVSDTVSTLR